MKKILTALLLSLAAFAAHAQTSATTTTTTASTSGASNQGVNQGITFNSPPDVHYSGSYTVRSTGNAVVSGFAGSFSSDYCGGTAGLAVGGPGFAVSGGAPKIDHGCTMLRSFERIQQAAASDPKHADQLRAAALEVLADIDPAVKTALMKHGLIEAEDPNVHTTDNGQKVYAIAQH